MRAPSLLALAALTLIPPAAAEAQSFNCRYARFADEAVICQDPELAALDERLSRVFFRVRSRLDPDEVADLDREQGVWLSRRHRCGPDADCIERSYRRRIRELRDE